MIRPLVFSLSSLKTKHILIHFVVINHKVDNFSCYASHNADFNQHNTNSHESLQPNLMKPYHLHITTISSSRLAWLVISSWFMLVKLDLQRYKEGEDFSLLSSVFVCFSCLEIIRQTLILNYSTRHKSYQYLSCSSMIPMFSLNGYDL